MRDILNKDYIALAKRRNLLILTRRLYFKIIQYRSIAQLVEAIALGAIQ